MCFLISALPLAFGLAAAVWGILLQKRCPFEKVDPPFWPYNERPGLALELAPDAPFVDKVLGPAGAWPGDDNRVTARKFQHYDFVFIPLYVLFFIAAAWVLRPGLFTAKVAIALAIATGVFDVIEDIAILSIIKKPAGLRPKPFGQLKWLFYFLTLGTEGALFFSNASGKDQPIEALIFGAVLVLIAAGGVISSIVTVKPRFVFNPNFDGITTASTLSAVAMLGLALAPLLRLAPLSWHIIGEYIVLLRVPIIFGLFVTLLPVLAFFTGARSLFEGLFDLTPLSILVVTVATVALSAMVCTAAQLVLCHAPERFRGLDAMSPVSLDDRVWLLIMLGLSLWVVGFAVGFSARQRRATQPPPSSPVGACVLGASAGLALSFLVAWGVVDSKSDLRGTLESLLGDAPVKWLYSTGLFTGYIEVDPTGKLHFYSDHLLAVAAYLLTILVYAVLGFYGWRMLGRRRTVPALCSALMVVTLLGWTLSALTFFFDAWRIPSLVIVVVVGYFASQSRQSDHYYHLRPRSHGSIAPLDPAATLRQANSPQVIVVAANGGGIQAGAWAARVLYGLLEEHHDAFQRRLRMVSSVSGGSVGSSYFIHWLANRNDARLPNEAAAESSLDEVAWGLAWPDFLRAIFPWILGGLIGRGRALEKAWCMNGVVAQPQHGDLDRPLSDWNREVAEHQLPAIVMNATLCETGERVVLATTGFGAEGSARVDACELHRINGEEWDVGIATAARLSASFTYVTPVSRSDGPGPQPHIADGGYYDNYGMASLVEWLDTGLENTHGEITDVLVIQIHGAPVATDLSFKRHEQGRGWFYQIVAPITMLLAVRTAGQVAHNDIELGLLKQKWGERQVNIESATFEFPDWTAPLSWHLTPTQIQAIEQRWKYGKDDKDGNKILEAKNIVRAFLQHAEAAGVGS